MGLDVCSECHSQFLAHVKHVIAILLRNRPVDDHGWRWHFRQFFAHILQLQSSSTGKGVIGDKHVFHCFTGSAKSPLGARMVLYKALIRPVANILRADIPLCASTSHKREVQCPDNRRIQSSEWLSEKGGRADRGRRASRVR